MKKAVRKMLLRHRCGSCGAICKKENKQLFFQKRDSCKKIEIIIICRHTEWAEIHKLAL
jgi:hypothetical protein